jgi:shikimate dehydrogenase
MGAVNTVYRQNGRWLGINTDVSGILKALGASGIDFQGKQWTIVGAGGVARAVAYAVALHARPKGVTTLGRSRPRLQGFLDDMRGGYRFPITGALLSETDLKEVLEKTDVLVNGTPVGMSPWVDETPVASDLLRRGQVVFDTVYTPIETRLLREARQRGCLTISGFQMFLHQGAAQFERWTGKTAPLTLMEQKARQRLSN